MSRRVAHVMNLFLLTAFLSLAAAPIAFAQATPSAGKRTYVWFGELVSFDSAAKAMTVRTATNEAVQKYLDRFKPGQHIVLMWTADNLKPETGPVRYIETYETMKSSNVNQGFILPVEFVSGDAAGRTVTFKAAVPEAAAQAVSAIQAGRSIKVTAPMSQPSETADIASIEASAPQTAATAPNTAP